MFAAVLTDGWSLRGIAAVNASLAWVAACVHMWAGYKTSGHIRHMFIGIAALAFFYSLSYWWLFWNPSGGAEWSTFLRPFGIITWIMAWSVEPIVLVRYLQRSGDRLVSRAQAKADEVKGRLDE